MQQRKLGCSGLTVSPIGLGCAECLAGTSGNGP